MLWIYLLIQPFCLSEVPKIASRPKIRWWYVKRSLRASVGALSLLELLFWRPIIRNDFSLERLEASNELGTTCAFKLVNFWRHVEEKPQYVCRRSGFTKWLTLLENFVRWPSSCVANDEMGSRPDPWRKRLCLSSLLSRERNALRSWHFMYLLRVV